MSMGAHEKMIKGARENRCGSTAWRRILLTAAMLLVSAAALILAGCESEPKTLEDYLIDSPSSQQEIEDSLAGLNNGDMDVSVTYDQNRVIITGDMKTTYKKTALKAMKKSYKKYMKKHLTEPMEKAVSSIEQDTGISGVSIQVIINNGNGNEIWSETYPLQEVEETAAEETAADESAGAEEDQDKSDQADKKETKDKKNDKDDKNGN